MPLFLLANLSAPNFAELLVTLREDLQHEAAVYLQTKQAALQTKLGKVNSHIAFSDSAAAVILDTVDELGIDTIVMSTHGRGEMRRWVFGSVADKVLQQVAIPIVLIRAEPSEEELTLTIPTIESPEDIRSHEE